MAFPYLSGLGFTEGQIEAFRVYREMLLNWNSGINLTAITDPEEVEIKHFLDSLLLNQYPLWRECFTQEEEKPREAHPGAIRVVDVGGGGGFPGIPLKIARQSIELVILEASQKRVNFLQALISALALKDVYALHIRAEEAGRLPLYREGFDWAVSRGVAALPALLEYCLPLLKVGGYMAAYKGPAGPAEAEAGEKAAAALGGEMIDIHSASLPGGRGERRILIYRKARPTAKRYPRKPGLPAKQPIV